MEYVSIVIFCSFFCFLSVSMPLLSYNVDMCIGGACSISSFSNGFLPLLLMSAMTHMQLMVI